MRLILGIVGLMATAPALAFESVERELQFRDTVDGFDALEYDTGWLPSGSPLAVRFYASLTGGTSTEMEATSQLTWPDAVMHSIEGVPGEGWFSLIVDIAIGAEVQIDLWAYTGTFDIWSDNLYIEADRWFDPLLLPGGAMSEVSLEGDGEGFDPIEIPVELFAGVGLNFVIDIWPRAESSLRGTRLVTNGNAATVLEPSMEVCASAFGCYEVASFEIPIPLVEFSQDHEFSPVSYWHPLPSLHTDAATFDFGQVQVGTLANLQLPLGNVGEMDLEGWVTIEGSSDITVYPEYFHASPGNTDGVVVTFAPSEAGVAGATLVLTTNDPLRPRIEIPVGGSGFNEDIPGESDGEVAHLKTCGCTTPAAPGGWALLLGLVALGRRRR
jgi:MYXO-CTERM domain-containing protein